MKRTLIPLGAIAGLAAVAGLVAAFTLRGGGSEPAAAAPAPANVALLSYAAKFVCGEQRPAASTQLEPPVKPGNYATEINIHNPNYASQTPGATATRIYKKLVILVGTGQRNVPFAFREPDLAKPGRFVKLDMPPDTATMDDCQAIWRMAKATGVLAAPGAFTIGYLVVMSRSPLDIDAVYTSSVPGAGLGAKATGIAMDVERVTPQRVAVPDTLLPK